jgi:hypothetical protein
MARGSANFTGPLGILTSQYEEALTSRNLELGARRRGYQRHSAPSSGRVVYRLAVADISLVVLAAGMARRFGSLKQVAPVGPGNESLVDYTVRDAAAAGVSRVVVVVRPEIADEVVAHVECRAPVPVIAVEQEGPDGRRARPWGTAEAVALGLAACPGPAVVANADDYYGADALTALVGWLGTPACAPGRAALVTYPLSATTSPHGPVSRAVCALGPGGRSLVSLVEHHGIAMESRAAISDHGLLPVDVPVSTNLWGFHPSLGPVLARATETFRAAHGSDPDAELALPTAVDAELAARRLTVDVLPSGTTWVGITHADDLPTARAAMARLAPVPVR